MAREELEHWIAADKFAPWVTGDIDLSPSKIIFQTGQEIRLSYQGRAVGLNLAPSGQTWVDEIFRVVDPQPVLKFVEGPKQFCDRDKPVTYITTNRTHNLVQTPDRDGDELGISFFFGDGPLTHDNYVDRFCGALFYLRARNLHIS